MVKKNNDKDYWIYWIDEWITVTVLCLIDNNDDNGKTEKSFNKWVNESSIENKARIS